MRKKSIGLAIVVAALVMSGGSGRDSWLPASAEADISQPCYVALTFDDGPRRETTERLLDGLRERGVNATFFLLGEMIAGNEDLVQRMAQEGHQIGNHGWSHINLQGQSRAVVAQETGRTAKLLDELLGRGEHWVRPPYGLLNADQRGQFSVPLVHWTVDPEDWKLRDTAADVQAVLTAVQPGDIVLLHDTVPQSVDAALQIADELQRRGYTLVTVEELLYLSGVEPQPGVFYRSATLASA